MARRIRKAEAQLLLWAIVIGVPIWAIAQLGETVGWIWLILAVVGVVVLYIWYRASQSAKRRAELTAKYRDEDLVEKLMSRSFWQGQTAGQLLDSLGRPENIDVKVLKTKKKEIWKYNHQGGNRYGLRITLDNDVVVGWDQKT